MICVCPCLPGPPVGPQDWTAASLATSEEAGATRLAGHRVPERWLPLSRDASLEGSWQGLGRLTPPGGVAWAWPLDLLVSSLG